jgi:Na+-translocating ferredoxin:NAD+ oxidoreductase RnfG subunit
MNELVKKSLKVGGILCAIGAVSAVLICSVNALTEGKIAANELAAQGNALKEVYSSALAYSDSKDVSGGKYAEKYWVAYSDEAKQNALGYIYRSSGTISYGSLVLLIGVSSSGLGKIAVVTDTMTYGDTFETNYLDKYNAGNISIDSVTCGATYAATLAKDMAKEALSLYQTEGN